MSKIKEKWKELLEDTDCLFYGELEYHLDSYIKKFFSVEVSEVGFDDEHTMNNLEFWFVVSMLVRMDMLDYGTSPRGAWLTDDGKLFKEYCLKEDAPITKLIHSSHEQNTRT